MPLARRQRRQQSLEMRNNTPVFAMESIAFDRELHSVEQLLIAKWLCQKLDCTGLHGLYRHRDVTVAGDEDDRYFFVSLGQLGLKIEPAG